MADQVTIPGTTPPAPASPPATTPAPGDGAPPPAAATPPAAAAPPAPPAAAAPPAAPPAATPPRVHRIPEADLKKRAQRRAEQLVQDQLGCSLEEAKKILEKAKASAPAAAAPAPGTAPEPGSAEEDRARRERERGDQWKKKYKRLKSTHEAEVFEMGLRQSALAASILEEHVDFALDQYQKHVQAEGPEKAQEPKAFFTGMRASRPYLFGAPAAPPQVVPVTPATAPPESTAPGGGAPTSASPPAPPPPKDVDDMSPEEFNRHLRSRHNYG